jgi:hypothetical protein
VISAIRKVIVPVDDFDFTPDGRGTDWYPRLSYE